MSRRPQQNEIEASGPPGSDQPKANGIPFEELCARIDAKEAAAAEAWAVWKRERAARL